VLGVTGAAVPTLTCAFVTARSYDALTAVGVAAKTLDVVEVESESCTAPTTLVLAAAMLIAGVAPPEEAIGAVPVTDVTPAAEIFTHTPLMRPYKLFSVVL
jgi:hypothetical protein